LEGRKANQKALLSLEESVGWQEPHKSCKKAFVYSLSLKESMQTPFLVKGIWGEKTSLFKSLSLKRRETQEIPGQ